MVLPFFISFFASSVPKRNFSSTLTGAPAGKKYKPGSGGTRLAYGSAGYFLTASGAFAEVALRVAAGAGGGGGTEAYGRDGSRRYLMISSLTPSFFKSSNSSLFKSKAFAFFL